jgi:hypothetical protein
MSKLLAKFLTMIGLMTTLSSCYVTTYTYYPTWHYNCYPTYDYWGWYMGQQCYWEYWSADGSVKKELDMVAEVADKDALILEKTATRYAETFGLSYDNAMKVAKQTKDLTTLQTRSASDLADFASKLYGVSPEKVVSAVSKSQLGMNEELDALIDEAAQNLNATTENMKEMIKVLHGNAMSEAGISL